MFAVTLSEDRIASNAVAVRMLTGDLKPRRIQITVHPADGDDPLSDLEGDFEALRKAPMAGLERMAAPFNREAPALFTVPWRAFTPELRVELGPGEGEREITVSAEWDSGPILFQSQTLRVRVDYTPPLIVVTNPLTRVTSQPVVQIEGYSDEPLAAVRYDVFNAAGGVLNCQGYVTRQHVDRVSLEITTNFFACTDVDLAPGTNTVTLRCTDHAGNVSTNLLTYELDIASDHTPPVIAVIYPRDGRQVTGTNFTARGRLDDPTARMVGTISGNGTAVVVEGLVERDGKFWVEHLPLLARSNRLYLTATDAAGNASTTNLGVLRSDDLILIDPVPANQLWRPAVTVTGRVSPPDQEVWVNGVQAAVRPDGSWQATGVNPGEGGTAVFSVTAIPKSGRPIVAPDPSLRAGQAEPLLAVQAALGTNSLNLNASQPACGTFRLQLSGTAGRSFVLLASTNLTDWTPVLTNVNSEAVFDFVDTSVPSFGCRFFRVLPLP